MSEVDATTSVPKRGETWDAAIAAIPAASPYHDGPFCRAISRVYRHRSWYLSARDGTDVTGVLPLFRVNSLLMGNSLVSLPFCDYGGIAGRHDADVSGLVGAAVDLARRLHMPRIELRQVAGVPAIERETSHGISWHVNTAKVRMRLPLPTSADALFAGFTPKLRAQIRRPQKEGCTVQSGGVELVPDFYEVWSRNMRDLGSPAHPPALMRVVCQEFGTSARVFVVYSEQVPIAGGLVIGRGADLTIPWASADRRYQKIAPNMLLYWSILSWAADAGYRVFDFGRSTEGEGTYRFKEQWGARPETLHWYTGTFGSGGNTVASDGHSAGREKVAALWARLPLWVTRVAGPVLRRGISL